MGWNDWRSYATGKFCKPSKMFWYVDIYPHLFSATAWRGTTDNITMEFSTISEIS